jgi:hypothetical protein
VSIDLTEISADLIEQTIKADIAAALTAVRTQRADPKVTTEPPRSYFIFEKPKAYQCPAIIIIPQGYDFRPSEGGANHINAILRIDVAVVVEDRAADLATRKAWRYQAALMKVLAQRSLTSADGAVKLVVVVNRAEFSPLFTQSEDPAAPEGPFRKEVRLECGAHHFEAFS